MRIDFAHIRERSSTGGSIDFAVFEAQSNAGTDSANAEVLAQLTAKARMAGHKIDQSALAFNDHSRTKFYGTKNPKPPKSAPLPPFDPASVLVLVRSKDKKDMPATPVGVRGMTATLRVQSKSAS